MMLGLRPIGLFDDSAFPVPIQECDDVGEQILGCVAAAVFGFAGRFEVHHAVSSDVFHVLDLASR